MIRRPLSTWILASVALVLTLTELSAEQPPRRLDSSMQSLSDDQQLVPSVPIYKSNSSAAGKMVWTSSATKMRMESDTSARMPVPAAKIALGASNGKLKSLRRVQASDGVDENTLVTPSLRVEISQDQPATGGQTIQLQVKVTNIGQLPVEQAQLVLAPSSNLRIHTQHRQQLRNRGREIHLEVPHLATNEMHTFEIRAIHEDSHPYQINAAVSVVSNAEFQIGEQQVADQAGAIQIESFGPTRTQIGTTVIYRIVVTNISQMVQERIVIEPQLTEAFGIQGKTRELVIERLAPGVANEFYLPLRVYQAGDQAIQFVASSTSGANAEHTSQLSVAPGALKLQIEGPQQIEWRKTGNYTIRVNNLSERRFDQVQVALHIAKGLQITVVDQPPHYDAQNGTLTWNVSQLEPLDEHIIQFRVHAIEPGVQVQQLTITDPTGATRSVQCTTVVQEVSKTASSRR